MADGLDVTPGEGAQVATDEIANKHYQRIKIVKGGDGVNGGDISDANPLPVTTELTQPTTPSDTQPISADSLPLPSGAATAANQQTDALTDTELRASPVEVDTGLDQPLTDTQLRANPVVVDLGANNDVTVAGVATASNQSTGNTSLSNIDTAIGAKADSSASSDTGTFSLIALFKRALEKLTSIVTATERGNPANINKHITASGTLSANTTATPTITVSGFVAIEIEIINVDGAAGIAFTLDGTDPVVPPTSANGIGYLVATPSTITLPCNGSPTLKLKSIGTPQWIAIVRGY